MEIVVVTSVPEGDDKAEGNLAVCDLDLRWSTGERDPKTYMDKTVPFIDMLAEILGGRQQAAMFMLSMRQQVFKLGEILILDESGREIGYPGRKPSKWFIEVTTVATLEEAAVLAQQTMYPKAEEAPA